MSTIVKDNGGGNFAKPGVGMHHAVCSNVYGPYRESYEWGGQTISANKIIILFELDERIVEGEFKDQRFVQSVRYTASLSEKAKLRPFLEAWRGRAFTAEELEGFDLDKLIGANAYLNLISKPKKSGGDTVMVASIMPIKKDDVKLTSELPRDYKPKWIADLLGTQTEQRDPGNSDDSEIPF
jgi:hypothetical protein